MTSSRGDFFEDILESHDDEGRPRPLDRVRRHGPRRLAVPALGAAIATVATSGVLVAGARIADQADIPARVVPASAIAYVELDLDPSVRHKLAVRYFAHRLPDVP